MPGNGKGCACAEEGKARAAGPVFLGEQRKSSRKQTVKSAVSHAPGALLYVPGTAPHVLGATFHARIEVVNPGSEPEKELAKEAQIEGLQ